MEGENERRNRKVHDFNHNFEKLNGFKIKGMWANTGRKEGENENGRRSRGRKGSQSIINVMMIIVSLITIIMIIVIIPVVMTIIMMMAVIIYLMMIHLKKRMKVCLSLK